MTERQLFERLPEFPPSLPADELQMLAWLPEWPTTTEVFPETQAIARRLERRKLIKVSRWLEDPAGTYRSWWAGKLPTAVVRAVGERAQDTKEG